MTSPKVYNGSPFGPPIHIGAKIYFNGFTFNDRVSALEMARLSGIDGLYDADIRDAREALPDVDGEVAYTALYGGRTLVLDGRLEAGNLESLMDLRRDMGRAFAPLTENDLIFLRYGVSDFFTTDTLANYTFDAGASGNVQVTSSVLDALANLTVENRMIAMYSASGLPSYPLFDARVDFPFKVGTTVTSYKAGAVLKRIDALNYVEAYVDDNGTNSRLRIDVIIGGTRTNRASTNLASRLTASDTDWFRARIQGNVIFAEYWSATYNDDAGPTLWNTYALASGSEQNTLGSAVPGRQGIAWVPQETSAAINDFFVYPLDPPDIKIACRKVQSLSGREQQSGQMFHRNFQVQLRASDPRFVSRHESQSQMVLAAGSNAITVYNNGNYDALPRFRVYGSVTNLVITNTTTGKVFTISGVIPDSDYWDIDFATRTILNAAGASQFASVSGTSDRITFAPGANALTLTPSAVGGSQANAKLALIRHKHSYMT